MKMLPPPGRILLLAVLILPFWTNTVRCEDWYRWRGPDLNGISKETGWSTDWPAEGPKQLWKAAVGLGFSSVVIRAGRVFTMGNRDDVDTVYCFSADTGKVIWQHSYPCATNPKYHEGGTSGTPTIDKDVVYVLSREGEVICFDAAKGSIVWTKNIAKALSLELPEWGFAGSPLVQGDSLILNTGTHGIALNKRNGEVIWSTGTARSGYASPVPFAFQQAWPEAARRPRPDANRRARPEADRRALLMFSGKGLAAVEAKTGKTLWVYPWETKYDINAADPIIDGDKVFISSGYRVGGALLKINKEGAETVWKSQEMHNQLNGSVLLNGHLYGISGQDGYEADLRCVELATGTVKWKERSVGFGALMVADNKLIVLGAKGELIVAEATPSAFKPISRAQVMTGKNWTTPILSNGRIYCRNSQGSLVCVDVRDSSNAEKKIGRGGEI